MAPLAADNPSLAKSCLFCGSGGLKGCRAAVGQGNQGSCPCAAQGMYTRTPMPPCPHKAAGGHGAGLGNGSVAEQGHVCPTKLWGAAARASVISRTGYPGYLCPYQPARWKAAPWRPGFMEARPQSGARRVAAQRHQHTRQTCAAPWGACEGAFPLRGGQAGNDPWSQDRDALLQPHRLRASRSCSFK